MGKPLDILAALGHGRSYGMRSSIMLGARALPGILQCGLWDALDRSRQQRPDLPTFALLTDIGNDLIYGTSPQGVVAWVAECIERLRKHHARIVMSALPIQTIRAVRPWQYKIVKLTMYPTRDLTYADALQRADDLHARLVELASQRGVQLIASPPHWYGFDPIHMKLGHWASAWSQMLTPCLLGHDVSAPCAKASMARWMRVRSHMPERWWLAGVPRHSRQPAVEFDDGTTLAMY